MHGVQTRGFELGVCDVEIAAQKLADGIGQRAGVETILLHEVGLGRTVGEGILQAEALETDAKAFLGEDFGDQRTKATIDGVVFERDDSLLAAGGLDQPVAVEGF
jgi:hypothetical protein